MPFLTAKLIMYAVIGLIGFGGLMWAYKAIGNHFIGIDNLQTQLSNTEARANRAEVSYGALQLTTKLREEHSRALTAIRSEHQGKIDTIRTDTNKSKEVLEDRERLSRVTTAKSGLVQSRANKATKRVFDGLESTFNQ